VALRVTHCPVNLAGVGWTNVQALRKRGVDARLVVFNTQPFRPDQADWDLKRPRKGLVRQQLVQWRALSKLLPKTDIFHFYFGLTLVPKSLQFPILKATRRKSLFHFLGADIRERPKEQLLYGLTDGYANLGRSEQAASFFEIAVSWLCPISTLASKANASTSRNVSIRSCTRR